MKEAAVVEKKHTQGKIAGYNQICKIVIFGMRYGNVIAIACLANRGKKIQIVAFYIRRKNEKKKSSTDFK